jgi:PAS domain-containing protein
MKVINRRIIPINTHSTSEPREAADEIARRDKIIDVLMNRIEQDAGQHASDYSFFQTAILLDTKVRERTARLDEAMAALKHTNTALEAEKQAAEAAQAQLVAAFSNSSDGFALFDADDRLSMANQQFSDIWQAAGSPTGRQAGATFRVLIEELKDAAPGADWPARWLALHHNVRAGEAANHRTMHSRQPVDPHLRASRGGTAALSAHMLTSARSSNAKTSDANASWPNRLFCSRPRSTTCLRALSFSTLTTAFWSGTIACSPC